MFDSPTAVDCYPGFGAFRVLLLCLEVLCRLDALWSYYCAAYADYAALLGYSGIYAARTSSCLHNLSLHVVFLYTTCRLRRLLGGDYST